MKKSTAEQQTIEQAANGPPEPSALVIAGNDHLAKMGFQVEFDGLSDVGQEDFRLGTFVWNMTKAGEGSTAREIKKTQFLNTITDEVSDELQLVLLVLHKSHDFSKWDNARDMTVRTCSSWDRVTGTLAESGKTRPCEGCPDAAWRAGPDGKRVRNCGTVQNVVAIEPSTGDLAMLRFKKTSTPAWTTFLNRHILLKRTVTQIVDGARRAMRTHYPLFAFVVSIKLTLETKGSKSYAVPSITVLKPVTSVEEITYYQGLASSVKDVYLDRFREMADSSGTEADIGDAAAGAPPSVGNARVVDAVGDYSDT